MSSFPAYQPPAAAPADPTTEAVPESPDRETGTPFRVLVEFSNNGQAKPPTLTEVGAKTFDTQAEAMDAARETAKTFRPPDPWSPQGRQVYTDGPSGFLTVVRGAMTDFHFSTRVVQLIDELD